jgi:hypothetical protein
MAMLASLSHRLTYRHQLLQALAALKAQPTPAMLQQWVAQLQPNAMPNPVMLQVMVHALSTTNQEAEAKSLADLLMAMATLDEVQVPLWNLIANPKCGDVAKDYAQLVLQTLGDITPIGFWMEHLNDPKALIQRETTRMVQLANQNPEAMVDFVDFFQALPPDEQLSLLASINATINPSASQAAGWLRALHVLQYAPLTPQVQQALQQYQTQHPLHQPNGCAYLCNTPPNTVLEGCYSSLPDGEGYQIVMVVRKHTHAPQYCVVSTVMNDTQGVIETFGFYSLSASEFWTLLDKTYEGCHKYPVPGHVAKHWLRIAYIQAQLSNHGVPYEFAAWQPALADIPEWWQPTMPALWAQPHWVNQGQQLLDHPDMATWQPHWGNATGLSQLSNAHSHTPHTLADGMQRLVAQPQWLFMLQRRLERCAWLFHFQQATVFRNLAATFAAYILEGCYHDQNPVCVTFLKPYVQRSLISGIPQVATPNPSECVE